MMARILIALLCSLLILQCVQGMSPLGRRRCHCIGRLSNSVDIKQIRKFEVFPESSRCEKMEVVAKLKNGEEKCLNPKAKLVKVILTRESTREHLTVAKIKHIKMLIRRRSRASQTCLMGDRSGKASGK